ncbi:ecotin family protein [Campylobacter geochelonis]|uniref:Ecotin n=1 Tax=Campylobacter geochelonis TaxID=1780362 RepID=A0A128EF46_9BACT|nr:ecotin family protein [Campylobacter geochelonis]QKF71860.1 putative serine protease inhibitor, Ecotin family [Campylobacter geochelonis]CZE47032.1 ecotin [Campylobacter geochelonis]CZE47388.1 ecotin [Campylobacter geochelonis]CZE50966.1 ecotin [Campylobacter geochelonis]
MKFLTVLMLFFGLVFAFDTSVFPKPKDGESLQTLTLKPLKNEQNYKVEVEFGKIVEVDCNHHFFIGGKLEQKNLDGYGYVYYKFSAKADMAGTLMACGDTKKEAKFIKFEPKISTYYNSALPLIIYTPKDVKIRYKVYKLVDEKFVDVVDDEAKKLQTDSNSSLAKP